MPKGAGTMCILLIAVFLVAPASCGARCNDFKLINERCPVHHGASGLVPPTCDDPHSTIDDQCAETFTEWYGRCFSTMASGTKAKYGKELTQFNTWCEKTLSVHQADAKNWPTAVVVSADAEGIPGKDQSLENFALHKSFMGTYTKTHATCSGEPVYALKGGCGAICAAAKVPDVAYIYHHTEDFWSIGYSPSKNVGCDFDGRVFDTRTSGPEAKCKQTPDAMCVGPWWTRTGDHSDECTQCPFEQCFPGGCMWRECKSNTNPNDPQWKLNGDLTVLGSLANHRRLMGQ